MATVDDIDTAAAVRKFLERRVVTDREDQTADTADEVAAILESIATTFLLHPQAALSFVLLAKNNFQQLVQKDIELLDYLLKAVEDVSNPNEAIDDTSDLIEAQTALVEVDRVGRLSSDVRAYDRYTAAVTRFLDRRLARSLKRRRKGEFERSGSEAKRDMFQGLAAQVGVHGVVAEKLTLLENAVSDFESIDLTRIVAGRTVTRVRNSLKKVLDGVTKRTLSKTSAAVELLAGAAALRSISKTKSIFDPIVETGEQPEGRTITARSEAVAAVSKATAFDLTELTPPWSFTLAVDGGSPQTVSLGTGDPFLLSAAHEDGLVDIDEDSYLYVQIEGTTTTEPEDSDPVLLKRVSLAAGVDQTIASLAAAIDAELSPDATCVAYGTRLLIVGDTGTTRIVLRPVQSGIFDIDGVYVPEPPSAHEALGFDTESERYVFSPGTLAAMLEHQVDGVSVEVESGSVTVRTESVALSSSLYFEGEVAEALGFEDGVTEPIYLELIEDGSAIDPAELGIIPGAVISLVDEIAGGFSFNDEPITAIDGTKLYFDNEVVPRCSGQDITVSSPLLAAAWALRRALQDYEDVGRFEEDVRDLQRALTPLLSQPTLAQINDAKRVVSSVRGYLDEIHDAISDIVVPREKNEFYELMNQILLSLEERGLDRASDLLRQGAFSTFFSLANTEASKSNRFLRAIEQVGRKDFPVSAIEEEQREPTAVASTPDDNILSGAEPTGDSENR